MSKILQNNLREVDSAYRYGGKELVVLLPSTYKEQAKQVARSIRERTHSGLYSRYKITVSIGVADSKAAEDGKYSVNPV